MENLKIINCTNEYWDFILSLRNDEEIKKGFTDQKEITKEAHYKYMQLYNDKYFICLNNNTPVGFVGVANSGIVSVVSKEYHNKGIGSFMLNFIKSKFPNEQAKIKVENLPCIKVIEKAGYKLKYYIYEVE